MKRKILKTAVGLEDRLASSASLDRKIINARLEELDREPDIETETTVLLAAIIGGGLALGTALHRRWLLLSATASAVLLFQAMTGWKSPLPEKIRRLRSRREIEKERFALKILRGDFNKLDRLDVGSRPDKFIDLLGG